MGEHMFILSGSNPARQAVLPTQKNLHNQVIYNWHNQYEFKINNQFANKKITIIGAASYGDEFDALEYTLYGPIIGGNTASYGDAFDAFIYEL